MDLISSIQNIKRVFHEIKQEEELGKESCLLIIKYLFERSVQLHQSNLGKQLTFELHNSTIRKQLNDINCNSIAYKEILADLKLLAFPKYLYYPQNSSRMLSIRTSQAQFILKQTIFLNGRFAVVSVFYFSLFKFWELSLYFPQHSESFKVYFNFDELKTIKKAFSFPQVKKPLKRSDATSPNDSKNKLEKQRKEENKNQEPAKFNSKNLKAFDYMTNTFKNRCLTEEFSVNKTKYFLQQNASFAQQSISKITANFIDNESSSLSSILKQTNSIPDTLNQRQNIQKQNLFQLSLHHINEEDSSSIQETSMNHHLTGNKYFPSKLQRMFNNSYLNCLFKLNQQQQKKKVDFNSVKSKEENDELNKVKSEITFNIDQNQKFWKTLIASLKLPESLNTPGLRMLISTEQLQLQKKLHRILFSDEVETYSERGLKLIYFTVSLELREKDNVQLLLFKHVEEPTQQKNPSSLICVNHGQLKIKSYDIQSGQKHKEKIKIKKAWKLINNDQNIPQTMSLCTVRDLARNLVLREYENEQSILQNYVNQWEESEFKYKPTENQLVQRLFKLEQKQDASGARNILKHQQLKYQEWCFSVKKKQEKCIYQTTILLSKAQWLLYGIDYLDNYKLVIQLLPSKKILILRIHDFKMSFNYDFRFSKEEISQRIHAPLKILDQWYQYFKNQSERDFQVKLSQRIINGVLQECLMEFIEKFQQYEESIEITEKDLSHTNLTLTATQKGTSELLAPSNLFLSANKSGSKVLSINKKKVKKKKKKKMKILKKETGQKTNSFSGLSPNKSIKI